MFKIYYQLAKPGIVYGNVFTTLAAFLFASKWHVSLYLFLGTLVGIALVIASACVCNNYLDRGIDLKMARTKERALVTGTLSTTSALLYAGVLGVLGFVLLFISVNALTAYIALFGFFFYVVVYGWAKRVSHWGTVVGSVSGAVPILVGYTAVTNRLDSVGLILFLILALWQMPHFYAIALNRMEEYRNAGVPVLPIQKGSHATKIYIVSYVVAFALAASLLWLVGSVGYSYLAGMFLVSLVWLWFGIRGYTSRDDAQWARSLFFVSLVVLIVFCLLLSVGPILP